MFIESSSFAVSTGAGSLVVGAGVYFLTLATPVGWVGLIVTAAAAAVSMLSNSVTKKNAGDVYDSIMDWLSSFMKLITTLVGVLILLGFISSVLFVLLG